MIPTAAITRNIHNTLLKLSLLPSILFHWQCHNFFLLIFGGIQIFWMKTSVSRFQLVKPSCVLHLTGLGALTSAGISFVQRVFTEWEHVPLLAPKSNLPFTTNFKNCAIQVNLQKKWSSTTNCKKIDRDTARKNKTRPGMTSLKKGRPDPGKVQSSLLYLNNCTYCPDISQNIISLPLYQLSMHRGSSWGSAATGDPV